MKSLVDLKYVSLNARQGSKLILTIYEEKSNIFKELSLKEFEIKIWVRQYKKQKYLFQKSKESSQALRELSSIRHLCISNPSLLQGNEFEFLGKILKLARELETLILPQSFQNDLFVDALKWELKRDFLVEKIHYPFAIIKDDDIEPDIEEQFGEDPQEQEQEPALVQEPVAKSRVSATVAMICTLGVVAAFAIKSKSLNIDYLLMIGKMTRSVEQGIKFSSKPLYYAAKLLNGNIDVNKNARVLRK